MKKPTYINLWTVLLVGSLIMLCAKMFVPFQHDLPWHIVTLPLWAPIAVVVGLSGALCAVAMILLAIHWIPVLVLCAFSRKWRARTRGRWSRFRTAAKWAQPTVVPDSPEGTVEEIYREVTEGGFTHR